MNVCHYCGKEATIFCRDPYAVEIDGLTDDESNPEVWWCNECLDQRYDDI